MDQEIGENIFDIIAQAEHHIKRKMEKHQCINKVILLGNTGSGKTTVSCIIAGKKILIKKYGKSAMLDFTGIQPGCKSITRIPSIMFNHENDILIGDCPGFSDTGGSKQEIVNAFSIDFLLSMFSDNYNKVKILLVIGCDEITSNRAQSITQNFERMEKMFPIQEQLEQGVGIIFTKNEIIENGMDCIEKLNFNPSPIVQKWCQFFEEHQDRVFVLPKALPENIGQFYQYENRSQLISFLKKDQITNPKHYISLNKSAVDDLGNEHFKICQKLNDIINSLFETIFEEFNNESNSSQLKKWYQILNRFKNVEIRSSKDLIRIIHEYLPPKDIFTNYITSLSRFEALDTFIIKVLDIKNDNIQKIFFKKNSNAISQLISTQKHFQSIEIREEELKNQKIIVAKQEQIAKDMKCQLIEQKKINEKYKTEMQAKFYEYRNEMKNLKEKINLLTNYTKLEICRPLTMKPTLAWKKFSSFEIAVFPGLLQTLSIKNKTNIYDDGLIDITSNSINGPSYKPRNVIDYKSNNSYAPKNITNSYLCFDFIDQKIQLQSYIMKSNNCSGEGEYYLKNWVIEVSNDNFSWKIIDEQNDCEGTNGANAVCIFNVSYPIDGFYRYVRLRQTGYSWSDNYIFDINYIDFYGILLQPI